MTCYRVITAISSLLVRIASARGFAAGSGFRAAASCSARTTSPASTRSRSLLPSVVLFAVAFDLLQGVIPFYAHAVLAPGSWLGSTSMIAVAIGSALACLPLFARLA
jgi:hypothetical protein